MYGYFFFFFKQKTAYEMRISDWSSDVCSSDLCYHGAALRDEHHFRPGLFMGKETFAARMALLARQGYPVIALDIAVAALPTGQWPRGATIVTIHDGWFGTYRTMAPVLRAPGSPETRRASVRAKMGPDVEISG